MRCVIKNIITLISVCYTFLSISLLNFNSFHNKKILYASTLNRGISLFIDFGEVTKTLSQLQSK